MNPELIVGRAAGLLAERLSLGLAVPSGLVFPYALYLYFGLDLANGSGSSLTALYISTAGVAYLIGALAGNLNAYLVVWLAPDEWLSDEPQMRRSATASVCAFFVACSAITVSGLYPLVIFVLLLPAVVCVAWLSNCTERELPG